MGTSLTENTVRIWQTRIQLMQPCTFVGILSLESGSRSNLLNQRHFYCGRTVCSKSRMGRKVNFTGYGYPQIFDPMGAGAIFHLRVRPAPRIGGCEGEFHFLSMGDPWIFKISNFNSFDPVSPSKFTPASNFWSSPIISSTQVPHRNPT
jgi:hypothetical protein